MIPNQLKHLSLEQKLALKITVISFVIFVLLIGTIITSSFLYLKTGMVRDFERETRIVPDFGFLQNIIENPEQVDIFLAKTKLE